MFIDEYFSEANGNISFTREQGSRFAKTIADDFNPLHDAEAKRFCIPGDLLFSIILARYGISQRMEFVFSGMVGEGVELILPQPAEQLHINDARGKEYLQVTRTGELSRDGARIENLARAYVEFSGHTFPHLLLPLLAEQGVMINPARPMVMYQSMAIHLERLDFDRVSLQVCDNDVEINGKRGSVVLQFDFLDAESGDVIGHGKKCLLLSGLREYDEPAMNEAVADHKVRKKAFSPIGD